MSQRIHDPTETGLPEYSTTGTLREILEELKDVSGRSDFRANLEISAYDRVITLSTCAYRFENARYVLHGKLVELR